MYIKSLHLDGFKCFKKEVGISNIDRHFTAVTGDNGSGKGSVLEAIYFVLGVRNLPPVPELIYESGKEDVTQARVSIVFDNSDKSSSPYGYEIHDEITVTRQVDIEGKDTFFINGLHTRKKRVERFFISGQLDVNNPHFVITQERITDICNMEPPEILSMIEEAADTRKHEVKKKAAEEKIDTSNAKLKEIDLLCNAVVDTEQTSNLILQKEPLGNCAVYQTVVDMNNKVEESQKTIKGRTKKVKDIEHKMKNAKEMKTAETEMSQEAAESQNLQKEKEIAYEYVSSKFRENLASLLPEAKACLQPLRGQQFLNGLEVKVGFADMWKKSLEGLSRSQRSLVALSLILAIWKFKPAPIYILDRVDTCLDPSNARKIGAMLKQHFKQHQFIVVSLEYNMLINANTQVKIKLLDGMSVVDEQQSTEPQHPRLSSAKRRRYNKKK